MINNISSLSLSQALPIVQHLLTDLASKQIILI